MRIYSTILGSLVALGVLSAVASAADLYSNQGSLKDSAGVATNPSIIGPYVEAVVGPAFNSSTVNLFSTGTDLSAEGGYVGGRGGWDVLIPGQKHFGVGVFGEIGTNFNADGKIAGGLAWREDLSYGAGGKLFFDHGAGQLYGLLEWAGAQTNFSAASGSFDKTLSGYGWGVGISLALYKGWYAALEFDQRIYDSISIGGNTPVHWSQDDNVVTFRTGVSLGNSLTLLH